MSRISAVPTFLSGANPTTVSRLTLRAAPLQDRDLADEVGNLIRRIRGTGHYQIPDDVLCGKAQQRLDLVGGTATRFELGLGSGGDPGEGE
jgi:hypothetical protein